MVCTVCFAAKRLDKGDLIANAELGGAVPLWELDRRRRCNHVQLLGGAGQGDGH